MPDAITPATAATRHAITTALIAIRRKPRDAPRSRLTWSRSTGSSGSAVRPNSRSIWRRISASERRSCSVTGVSVSMS
jgi:hypothetical protein